METLSNRNSRQNSYNINSSRTSKISSSSSLLCSCYEQPLGYTVEDVRPRGGVDIFRSAAYSNVSVVFTSCRFMVCFGASYS